MRVFIELNTNTVLAKSYDRVGASSLTLKERSGNLLEVQWVRDGVPELPSGGLLALIEFGIKDTDDYDGDALAFIGTASWTAPANASGFFTAQLDTDTQTMRAVFNDDGQIGNDLSEVAGMCEFRWRADVNSKWARSNTVPVVLHNSVIKGTEVVSQLAGGVNIVTSFPGIDGLTGGFVAASQVLTFAGNLAAADTIQVGGVTYTMVATLTGTAYQILVGASQAASQANVAAAINAGTGSGSTYGTGTSANASVTAAVVGSTVVVTARATGPDGNAIAVSEVSANASWGAATLANGKQNLDGIATANGAAPLVIATPNLASAKFWHLAAGTDATGGGVQRPADYHETTNAKVWKAVTNPVDSITLVASFF